jgi:GTP cyclohydrolase I
VLPDIQDQADSRGIALDEVGISGVRYPVELVDGTLSQSVMASFDVLVTLPADRRGTHMSRMVELIHDHFTHLDPRELALALKHVASKLDVESAQVRITHPIAIPVTAPATGRTSFQASDVFFDASIANGEFTLATSVTSQVTSLCPCSKAISDYGAHNQRSDVSVAIRGCLGDPYPMDVAQVVDLIRSVGSCPVYPLVKRPDERAITMEAFDHPVFVEDMARDLSLQLRSRGLSHEVSIRNLESIHSHDAVACVAWSG